MGAEKMLEPSLFLESDYIGGIPWTVLPIALNVIFWVWFGFPLKNLYRHGITQWQLCCIYGNISSSGTLKNDSIDVLVHHVFFAMYMLTLQSLLQGQPKGSWEFLHDPSIFELFHSNTGHYMFLAYIATIDFAVVFALMLCISATDVVVWHVKSESHPFYYAQVAQTVLHDIWNT